MGQVEGSRCFTAVTAVAPSGVRGEEADCGDRMDTYGFVMDERRKNKIPALIQSS